MNETFILAIIVPYEMFFFLEILYCLSVFLDSVVYDLMQFIIKNGSN